ncbi:uncharacterized protein LOC129765871 [Toxorhynchites rutilus septentrionalis]|uniref:uncharacterized protein LOC129765871 n=1 Tax=Toxorhynchites rutilus septentrionalis TaxID=329112 RepID=UPI002479EF76|nr:uncharacterized protein LOC129765871 [Toxorhynchites rutilus septentrionalis]
MNNLLSMITNYVEQRDKLLLEGWMQRLEKNFSDFQSNRLQMELLEDPGADAAAAVCDEEGHRRIRSEFERDYMKVYGFIASKLKPEPTASSSGQNGVAPKVTVNDSSFARIRLPEVKLPTFDGTLANWLTFRDAFVSLIDSNPQLKPIDKFSYLVSSLSKEAKRVIESIEITAANYSVAWGLLEKRFDNKKLIVRTYIEYLLSIEPMRKECYESLARIIDEFERNLNMIQKMNVKTEGWSVLLAHMLCARLDSATLKQWEQYHSSTEIPKYENVIEFLRGHCSILQSLSSTKPRTADQPKSEPVRYPKPKFSHAVITNSSSKCCPFCTQSSHSPFHCEAFRKLPVSQRFEIVKKNSLCINCFSPSHLVRQCQSSCCRVCGQKHHTMLHQKATPRLSDSNPNLKPPTTPNQSQSTRNSTSAPSQSAPPQPLQPPNVVIPPNCNPSTSYVSTTLLGSIRTVPLTVLLQTAMVKIADSHGYAVWARALLDPASQLNLMTEQLSQKLKLRRIKTHQEIGGVGNATVISSYAVDARIKSHCSTFLTDISFHVLPGITRELPAKALCTQAWNIPVNLVLADPTFHQPGPIDMILGMEVYYELIEEGLIRLGPDLPVLQKTVLGWVVSGKVGASSSPTISFVHVCSISSLEEQLLRFWEIESCQSRSTLSVEETLCEAHFAATTTRNDSGRFITHLPKRSTVLSKLGNSKKIATRRFLALERRLNANPQLKKAYSDFIEEYYQQGHMEEITESEGLEPEAPSYYLPHHCVVRPDSLTTKLRVVFDASCATDSGISLNDGLMIGPVVQDDLVSITLRFRIPRYAIVSDIEKMYRQILLASLDRQLLKILWRDSPSEPLRTFQLTTVTYGTSCAPYQATRCLQEIAKIGEVTHPEASKVVSRDFYMDDLLTGVDDILEGQQLCSQLLVLLQSAGFCLRKWSSNCSQVLEHFPAELRDERTVFDLNSSSAPIKTLGLKWQTTTDEFLFDVPKWNDTAIITKRIALSDAAKLFDPLGLVGPVIVQAKIYLQDLWRSQKEWDEPLDNDLQQRWLEFRKNLDALRNLSVPRWVVPVVKPVSIEMHGFCDASEKAYGACIYLRALAEDGSVYINLLTAKSKIAPLGDSRKQKRICLPRLELSAALLLAHLFQKVQNAISLVTKAFFWSDSTIVLHWLSATPSRWKTFIANRVSEIQHATAGGLWAHVSGSENPADIISRGMDPEQLISTQNWWHGPDWLTNPSRFWPAFVRTSDEDFVSEDLEERPVTLAVQLIPANPIFALRSSYTALLRLIAWVRRFTFNTRPANRTHRRLGLLNAAELEEACKCLVRIAQQEAFREEFTSFANTGEVKTSSKLKALTPFIEEGILRVGGRLRHAIISPDRKHPMILPSKHPFSELVARYYHLKMLHAGPQLLIASLREKFWPLRARNLARKIVHSCINCFRCRPRLQQQIMGDLPTERVSPTSPFLRTGVDLCGPIYFRYPHRKSQPIKGYVAVFVCLSIKAAHIELVGDLSTASFLAALRRFIARRGKPRLIECDNARNFRGASREVADLANQLRDQQLQNDVIRSCADDGIDFKFIPPRSPNFGGLWEAAIKSFKTHLKATLGNSILTVEQLTTLLAQIESCMNSRPLTQISPDPEDLDVLTPGHFLIHRPLATLAEPSYEQLPFNRLDHWQQVQEFLRRLWKRWATEYLSGLQPKTKWTRKKDNISIGTLVLVKDDGLPPLKWRYGRVTHIFRGDDGNIRVVVVKTKDGEYRRTISKICVLPIDQSMPPAASEAADDL